jgi:dihydrolipoamide dehydrogenase
MYDLCVIGAGPGGYVAAIQAARKGIKTLLVEKDSFGGTCLNVGCIPTKTLLASAEVLKTIKSSANFGIQIEGNVTFNWQAVQARKTAVVEKLRNGIAGLLKNAGVVVVNGTAEFLSKNKIIVKVSDGSSSEVESEKFIIATGSKPSIPAFIPKSPRVLDSTTLLSISEIPKSLIVLGGGVIGCEFASLFSEIGTDVTIVEMMSDILPEQDSEIAKQLAREFKKRKIKVFTGKPLSDIKASDVGVSGKIGDVELASEYMLVSIGRIPDTLGLNLKAAGVFVNEKGFIPVDFQCRTNVPDIYAIGDVTGRAQLAHVASAMAYCAAENAAGEGSNFSDCVVPGCIFTSPEIGSVGLTQEKCTSAGLKYKVGKFPFSALGKSMAINETVGFCKIIASEDNDKILGVHIIGAHATDLISEAATAIEAGLTATQLGNVIHPHPTLGEVIMEAAHDVHKRSSHVPVMKK